MTKLTKWQKRAAVVACGWLLIIHGKWICVRTDDLSKCCKKTCERNTPNNNVG